MNRPISLIILGAIVLLMFPSAARGVGTATIPIEACSWNATSLTVRIIPGPGLPSYKSSYLTDVVAGIRNWNQAINVWTDNYGSSYLAAVHFWIFIDGFNQTTSSQVTVSFVSSLPADGSVLGQTGLTPNPFSPTTCASATVQFATQDISSDALMTSVASHEFGHVLGLGHSPNISTDDGKLELMHEGLPDLQAVVFPSTLDVYALTQIFKWDSGPSGSFYRPSSSSFSLPEGIPYRQLTSYQSAVSDLQSQVEALRARLSQLQAEAAAQMPIAGLFSWSSIIILSLVAVASMLGVLSIAQQLNLRRLREGKTVKVGQTVSTSVKEGGLYRTSVEDPSSPGQTSPSKPPPTVDSWTVCSKCGAFISADIDTCVCGEGLRRRRKWK